MSDILDRLREAINRRPGTADSDVNAIALPIEVRWGDVTDAITEIKRLRSTIEQLRSIAGAANIDRPFSEIKDEVSRQNVAFRQNAGLVEAMHQRRDVIAAEVLNDQFQRGKSDVK